VTELLQSLFPLRKNKRYHDFGFPGTGTSADLFVFFLDLNPATLNLPANFTSCTRPKNNAINSKAVSIKVVLKFVEVTNALLCYSKQTRARNPEAQLFLLTCNKDAGGACFTQNTL
jgi:hypothetical protein